MKVSPFFLSKICFPVFSLIIVLKGVIIISDLLLLLMSVLQLLFTDVGSSLIYTSSYFYKNTCLQKLFKGRLRGKGVLTTPYTVRYGIYPHLDLPTSVLGSFCFLRYLFLRLPYLGKTTPISLKGSVVNVPSRSDLEVFSNESFSFCYVDSQ